MKINKISKLLLLTTLTSVTAYAEHIPIGSHVLAECHGFFTKGKIKRMHKESYVINFDKDSRPVMCTPFAWDAMFLVPYQPVNEYTGKLVTKSMFFSVSNEEVFKIGDQLKITFEAKKSRSSMLSKQFSVTTTIQEINANGAALLKVTDGEQAAKQAFELWVGTNYVLLDFTKDHTAERLSFTEVEKL